MRYVWLNPLTGEFSNSWSEEEMNVVGGKDHLLRTATPPGWKLISYTCENDSGFNFSKNMKLR